jgi:hypothetical protein
MLAAEGLIVPVPGRSYIVAMRGGREGPDARIASDVGRVPRASGYQLAITVYDRGRASGAGPSRFARCGPVRRAATARVHARVQHFLRVQEDRYWSYTSTSERCCPPSACRSIRSRSGLP